MKLARARSEDAAGLAATLPEPWTEVGFQAQLARPEARAWLAREGPQTVGFGVAHRVLEELQVVSLAVAAPFRRLGTGRALLEKVLEAEPGVREVHLEARSNDAAAQAFYRRVGFGEVGRLRRFYPGGVDAVLMRRAVPPEPS